MAAGTDLVFVYSTFPDEAAAKRVSDAMLAARLADNVNIYGPIAGVTERNGKLEADSEYAAYIRTRRELAGHVIATARPLHPYRIPCFLILPFAEGNDTCPGWLHA